MYSLLLWFLDADLFVDTQELNLKNNLYELKPKYAWNYIH